MFPLDDALPLGGRQRLCAQERYGTTLHMAWMGSKEAPVSKPPFMASEAAVPMMPRMLIWAISQRRARRAFHS